MNDITIAGGQITNADLLRVLTEMRADNQKELGLIREELGRSSIHMERVDTRNEQADKLHIDHEGRLRVLEKIDYGEFVALKARVDSLSAFRYKIIGICTALSAVMAAGGAVIGHFL